MLLESYFDDSADPRRNRYYACGGFIGGSEQWDAFVLQWSHLSRTLGLKEPFRSTDCEGGHGQFSDPNEWPKPRRDKVMERLVDVVYATMLRGFASIVPIDEYKAAFPQSGEHDAFLLAVRQTIMNMAWIADELRQDAGLWFERGTINGLITQVFNSIANWKEWAPTRRLRSITFDTKELWPLQAADLVAREAFKHIDNLGVRPTRIPVERLGGFPHGGLYFILWNEPALQYLAANGGPDNLELLAQWDTMPDAPRLGPNILREVKAHQGNFQQRRPS